ncbi:MAG TPA: GMC family oxidoreductase [Saprospiraceae bacterium]|nr:GMC family oxidoreductase [Saprospiraceae bacterium]
MSFQIKPQSRIYDVCIVGSGAGGGMAAKVLADAGLDIAIVEAGSFYDPAEEKSKTQMKWPWESPRRGASTTRPFGDFDAAFGGWEIEGEPYTRKEGTEFDWFRAHMLGGRTNHWGRISLRFGPLDFKRKSIDGLGEDWPISYEDVKPYYDKVDKLIGVFGTKENIYNEPDGFFLPPPKPRLHEYYYMKTAEKLGIPVIPARLSILTQKINDDRGVCYYCRQCNRGCNVYADFSSGSVLIKPLLKKGNIDIYLDAMVRKVETDEEGKAKGVSYIYKRDGKDYGLRAKVVVLAASACSSARILMNSKSSQHPNGLGNSSDMIGRYLHDSTGASRSAIIPALLDRKRYNEDGVGGFHVYTPWWLDNKKLDFPRGYHIELGGGMGMPSYGFGFNIEHWQSITGMRSDPGGYGVRLKEDMRKFYGATIGFAGRGESIPQYHNRCTIDNNVVDQWGIPVLQFDYKWTDYEVRQAKHMHDTFDELIHGLGGIPLNEKPGKEKQYGLENPGRIIHEVGTTRMGNDNKTSVVNSMCQAHEVPNLFVADGGPFVSQADKNPTWTIMALAWRTSEYIIDQLNKMNI